MQTGIVLVSKAVRFISIFFARRLLEFSFWCKESRRKLKQNSSISNNESGSELQPNLKLDLSPFVLYLEGEEDLVELITESNYYEGPLNCWAYPVVTPTTSAVALPNIGKCPIKHFMRSVNEGLSSVRLKNHNLDAKELINIRKAADTIWVGVDLYHKGLGVDIHKMGPQAKGPKQELEELDDIAKKRLTEYSNKNMAGCLKETPSMLPIKVLAANSMYRIGRESRFLPFILSIYIKKM
ncbi:hypothetical protein VitviT2T_021321 [Vitis vinifera]|uniref:Uncharacterized protein n=1 Tax=Vitis vinifera TaxID=29760 RepID=A0ABY9D8Q9_VITVI|nr:hypothetical protein VitviT2T_021321 [Vitis vinifera]